MVYWRQMGSIFGALLGAVALLLVLAPGAWGQDQPGPSGGLSDRDPDSGAPYAADELIVTFESGISETAREAVARTRGGCVKDEIPAIRAKTFSFPAVKNERARDARQEALERIKRALEQNPIVEAVDYNYQVKASWYPNDYRFRTQQWGPYKIEAPKAWDKTRGYPGVRIAVVDSGISSSHPDIRGKVVGQRDFVNNDAYAQDDNGHGTHVAGIAAGVTNNGQGVAGTCPSCTILAAKTLGPDATGYMDDVAQGITWGANNGARVINR